MIIADTSVWIEYLRGNQGFADIFQSHLMKKSLIALSPVFGELFQGVRSGSEQKIVSGFWYNLPHVNEDHLFIEAGYLSSHYGLMPLGVGLIDCYILAAAIKFKHDLWTLDKKLNKAIKLIVKDIIQ